MFSYTDLRKTLESIVCDIPYVSDDIIDYVIKCLKYSVADGIELFEEVFG